MHLTEMAEFLGAELYYPPNYSGEKNFEIGRVRPIHEASKGDVTFISHPDYLKFVPTTGASAMITKEEHKDCPAAQLVHRNPYFCFAKVAQLFHRPHRGPTGVSEQAFIAENAVLGETVTVYPFAFVGSGAKLGDGVTVYPGAYIGEHAEIGENTVIHPNCYIGHEVKIGKDCIIHAGSVLGADGFGFATDKGQVVKIPQIGTIVIEDHVEMGGLCTVDRAAMGETRIKKHSKLDSKVHIAHNVEVGERCMMSALTGVAGSTIIGDDCMFGGHSGVSGHLNIKNGVKVGAMTGVIKDNTVAGETYLGFPGIPAKEWKRQLVHLKRLPSYESRLKKLEADLA
ncbi:UDP-3-O-(3-hydroxymyristoyl)glucosamine N-acyltransferase [Oligoflexaceae bacterium]|nr:UDP-3-O-(3-hydroxymyristoyl)glucosamine N-acyltransferase [Oligoflexaceae bacterium]